MLGYLTIRSVNGVLALASLATFTRLLSPSDYGRYALAAAGISVTASVLFQWLNAGVLRLHAAHAGEMRVFLREVKMLFCWATALGLVVLVLWLAIDPVRSIDRIMALAIVLGGISMGAYNLILQLANARMQPWRYGAMSITRASLTLALGASFVLAGAGVNAAIFAMALGALLSAGLVGIRWRPADDTIRSPKLRRQIVSYGMPLALTYAATMVIDVSDRFLIGAWYGPAAVAAYAAGYDLVQQTIGVIMNVFFLAAYPRITAAWEQGGTPQARRTLQPLGMALLWVGPICAGGFIGLSPQISSLVFGGQISEQAASIMPWIAVAITIGTMKAYFLDIGLQLQKRTRHLLLITLLMAAANVAVNLVLLPRYGAVGSAYAAVVAFAIGAVASCLASRRSHILPLNPLDVAKAPVCAAVLAVLLGKAGDVATIAHLPAAANLAIRIGVASAAFAALAFALDLGGVRRELRARQLASPSIR